MKYRSLSPEAAKRYLESVFNGEVPDMREFERVSGSGDEHAVASCVDSAVSALEKVRRRYPRHLKNRDKQGGAFEAEACEFVHRALVGVTDEVLADMDFWTWLAVARCRAIVEWRFGADNKAAKPANYGIGNRVENLVYRLWLRADLALDPAAKDPYHLAKTGDQDLWRSHIIRQGYASARPVARSLIRLQAGQLGKKRLKIDDVRAVAKLLKRLRANIMFEYLSPQQAEGLVLETCERVLKQS